MNVQRGPADPADDAEPLLLDSPADCDRDAEGAGVQLPLFLLLLWLRLTRLLWLPVVALYRPGWRYLDGVIAGLGGRPRWVGQTAMFEALRQLLVAATLLVFAVCVTSADDGHNDDDGSPRHQCWSVEPQMWVLCSFQLFSDITFSLRDSYPHEHIADARDVVLMTKIGLWESALDSDVAVPDRAGMRRALVANMHQELHMPGRREAGAACRFRARARALEPHEPRENGDYLTPEYRAQLAAGEFSADEVAAQILVLSGLRVFHRSTFWQTAAAVVASLLQVLLPDRVVSGGADDDYDGGSIDSDSALVEAGAWGYGICMGFITLAHARLLQRGVAVFSERRLCMRALTALLTHRRVAGLPLPQLDVADADAAVAFGRMRALVKDHATTRMRAAAVHMSLLIALIAVLDLALAVEFAVRGGDAVFGRLVVAATLNVTFVGVAIALIMLIGVDINAHATRHALLLRQRAFALAAAAAHEPAPRAALAVVQAQADLIAAEGTYCTFLGVRADGAFVAKIMGAVAAAWAAQAVRETVS